VPAALRGRYRPVPPPPPNAPGLSPDMAPAPPMPLYRYGTGDSWLAIRFGTMFTTSEKTTWLFADGGFFLVAILAIFMTRAVSMPTGWLHWATHRRQPPYPPSRQATKTYWQLSSARAANALALLLTLF